MEQTFLVLNSIWVISTADKLPDKPSESEPVFYGNIFYLFHKTTGKKVDIDQSYKSPVTQNAEGMYKCDIFLFIILSINIIYIYIYYIIVSITSFKNETRCQLMATNSAKNNNDCILSKDIITLKNSGNYILRSHEFTFTNDNKTYQEVVGHNERIGGNDEVCLFVKVYKICLLYH